MVIITSKFNEIITTAKNNNISEDRLRNILNISFYNWYRLRTGEIEIDKYLAVALTVIIGKTPWYWLNDDIW